MTQPTIQVLLDDVNNGGTFPYDITSYVRLPDGVTVTRGRGDEFSEIQASTLSLTLENTDGRFTLGSTVGGYGGALNTDRRIRYKVTANSTTTTRFSGYVQTWPVEWPDGGDTFAVAQVTAVDALARMARKTLRSIIEEEILLDAPLAYYTLGEPAAATTVGDSSGVGLVPTLRSVGSGAAIVFGSATGPGTDGLTAAQFSGGKYLAANLATFTAPSLTLECFFATTTVTGGTLVALPGSTLAGDSIALDTTGKILWATSGATPRLTSTAYNDGLTHHIALSHDTAGGTASLYVDGVSVDSAGAIATVPITAIQVGAALTSSVSHVAFYGTALSAARIAAHAAAGLTGFAGETSDQRITRLATYGRVTALSVLNGSNKSVPFVDITGASPLAAITDVDKAEGGAVFIRGDGTLVMQPRAYRAVHTTPDLTLTNNDLDPGCQLVADMQLVENVVTASAGANGAVQTAVNATSRTAHGDYPVDLTGLLVGTDELALNAAQWRVGKYAEPFKRMPALELDLTTLPASTQAGVMALEISDRIQVTGLPSQAGTSALDLIVEGWTETLAADSWTWAANTSNFAAASAWVLENATYGVLDSTTQLSY